MGRFGGTEIIVLIIIGGIIYFAIKQTIQILVLLINIIYSRKLSLQKLPIFYGSSLDFIMLILVNGELKFHIQRNI